MQILNALRACYSRNHVEIFRSAHRHYLIIGANHRLAGCQHRVTDDEDAVFHIRGRHIIDLNVESAVNVMLAESGDEGVVGVVEDVDPQLDGISMPQNRKFIKCKFIRSVIIQL